jgi:LacI family transcriptional regulator
LLVIREVARVAGVSLGTVSRVINGNSAVAAELRERVLKAIDELGYRPNVFARGLRDGLLLASSVRTRSIEVTANIPVVAIGRPLKNVPSVAIDDRNGAIQAIKYLFELGHRDIACIAGPRVLSVALDRYRGYLDAAGPTLLASGIAVRDRARFVAFDYEGGYKAASELLAAKPRPTAIFASSDQQAIGALRAAGDAGMDVPRDLSIVGFDNIPLTNLMIPRITTVAQPIAEIGQRGVQAVIDMLAGHSAPIEQRLGTTLIIRDSCAPPASKSIRTPRRRNLSSAEPR